MAAVTNVRVESNGRSIAALRWTDNGGAGNDIKRSTDGTTYTTIATVAVDGTQLYNDSQLDSDTKYWYKVNNGTDSAVVTVWTHDCRRGSTQADTTAVQNQDPEQAVTALIGGSTPGQVDKCTVCASDGKVVLNCLDGCQSFQVVADDDINSISIIGCGPCPPIDFLVPAGTIGICGWPEGCDHTGDECRDAPVTGPGISNTSGQTYPRPGGMVINDCSCQCDPHVGASLWLGIQACEKKDGTLANDFTCPWLDPVHPEVIPVKACGGVPPFVWSVDNDVTPVELTVTDFAGVSATVTFSAAYLTTSYDPQGKGEQRCVNVTGTCGAFQLDFDSGDANCWRVSPSGGTAPYSLEIFVFDGQQYIPGECTPGYDPFVAHPTPQHYVGFGVGPAANPTCAPVDGCETGPTIAGVGEAEKVCIHTGVFYRSAGCFATGADVYVRATDAAGLVAERGRNAALTLCTYLAC